MPYAYIPKIIPNINIIEYDIQDERNRDKEE